MSLAARFLSFAAASVTLIAVAGANEVLELERYARIGRGGKSQKLEIDIKDPEINSPKSVRFSQDARKIYINSLEGGKTVIYSWPDLKKLRTISHEFTTKEAELFQNESTIFNYPYYSKPKGGDVNIFMGKPVESELSHGGRWLWIPYYRRDFDKWGQSPGAVAIIDTEKDEIVRVMPTGPIPKYVAASPDGRYVAVVHWGDNTVGIIDTSSNDPRRFQYVSHLVVEEQLSQKNMAGKDRDAFCGFCLRGTVFSPDGDYLLVARMGKGGIAGFHIPTATYLGSIMKIKDTPRHLALSPDGANVFASSNVAGYVSKTPLSLVLESLIKANGKRVNGPKWIETKVGAGARTLDLTTDGRLIFVAVNNSSEVVAVDAELMQVVVRLKVDPYAVGLAVAPDTSAVVLTSQGKKGVGGNAVNIVRIELGDYYKNPPSLVQD